MLAAFSPRLSIPRARASAVVTFEFVLVLLGGLLVAGAGCGRQAESDPPPESSPTGVADRDTLHNGLLAGQASEDSDRKINGTDGNPVVSGALGLLADEQNDDVDDPTRDGWTTEVLSKAAKQQLKKLAKLGAKPKTLDQGGLAPLVADNFRGSPLRPPELRVVYEQAPIHVLRPRAEGNTARRVEGRSALVQQLISLYTFGGKTEQARVEFKTYRVANEPGGFVTREFVSVFATGPGGSNEQTADWTCRWTNENPPRLREITVNQYEAVEIELPAGVLLSDCTESVLGKNASFVRQLLHGSDHWLRQIENTIAVDEYGHHGVAVGDANGDGLEDIYVCQQAGLPNQLFLQHADGSAGEVSHEAGVDWMESTHSALFVDLDNDGDQDLVIATVRALLAMENDGRGRFTLRWQFATEQAVLSLSASDVNNDAQLDLYGCVNYPDARGEGLYPRPLPYHDANNGGRNLLWENKIRAGQPWQFDEVTREVGLDDDNSRFTLAAAWDDFDNDGDADLYVANDYGRNCLYRNEGGYFRNVAAIAGVEDASFGMSAAWGDYNRDGRMDLYVSNMFSGAGNRVTYQRRFAKGREAQDLKGLQYLARGNSLFQNSGDGSFVDVSQQAGVTIGRWAWASQFADLNNDGWEDLLVANGFLSTDDDRDL